MKTFEFDGEKYKNASKHQKQWGNKLISELSLKGNETILDLGCGDGVLTSQLAVLVREGHVTGIDASQGMIKTAQTHKMNNLSFIHQDINRMEFNNEFDVIFSNAALHWIKNHKQLLQRAYNALKSKGLILWNFAGDGNSSNFFTIVKEKMAEDKYNRYFSDFEWPWYMPSKSEYEQLSSNIGFSKILIDEENADRYFSGAEEMIRWIDQPSLVPFLKCIPEEAKSEFRNDVVDEMLKRTKQPDGTCFETFRRIKVNAIK